MDLEKVWQRIVKAMRSEQFRSGQITATDLNEFVGSLTKGKYRSVDDLKEALGAADATPGKLEGIARSAHQGLTLGWGDELSGAMDALLGGNYAETRDAERQANSSFKAANPKTAFAAELGGGLLLPAGGAATAGRVLPSLGRMALTGAAIGGGTGLLSGAGASEAETPEGVLADAASTGAVGAGLGAGLGALTRPVVGLIGGVPRVLEDLLSPESAASRRAQQGLARLLPDDAAATGRTMEALRPGQGSVADVSPVMGDALRAAANKAPSVRSAAEEMVTQRGAGAGDRLASDLLSEAGVPGLDVKEIQTAAGRVVGRGKLLNRKLYEPLERAYSSLVPSDQTAPVLELLTDPRVEEIYAKIAGPGGRTGTPGFTQLQSVLHRLQDETSVAYRSGATNRGSEYQSLAESFERAMEEAMPGFKAANRGYATTMHTVRAFDDGAQAMARDARDVAAMLERARKSGGEEAVTAFRMGGLDHMATQLRALQTNRDASRAIVTMGPELEARLAQLFPDEKSLRRFLARADVERMFARTAGALKGNSTTVQQAEMIGSITGTPTGIAGGREGMIHQMLQGVDKALFGDLAEQSAEQAGQRLMARGPRLQAVIRELEEARFSLLARQRRTSTFGGIGAPAVAGGQTGLTQDREQR